MGAVLTTSPYCPYECIGARITLKLDCADLADWKEMMTGRPKIELRIAYLILGLLTLHLSLAPQIQTQQRPEPIPPAPVPGPSPKPLPPSPIPAPDPKPIPPVPPGEF